MVDDAKTNMTAAATESDKAETTPAERVLAEAAERRAKADRQGEAGPREVNGPKGLEPTRYGDWEKGGIASDF